MKTDRAFPIRWLLSPFPAALFLYVSSSYVLIIRPHHHICIVLQNRLSCIFIWTVCHTYNCTRFLSSLSPFFSFLLSRFSLWSVLFIEPVYRPPSFSSWRIITIHSLYMYHISSSICIHIIGLLAFPSLGYNIRYLALILDCCILHTPSCCIIFLFLYYN